MIPDTDYFRALNGRKFRYIGLYNPTTLKVWEKMSEFKNGYDGERAGGLMVKDVDVETLKEYKIWEDLSEDVQKMILDRTVQEQDAVMSLMGKARAGRKNKYPNVPRELICTKCQSKTPVIPGALVKKVEKIAKSKNITMTVDDYVKGYQCRKCLPVKRGKPANPEFANLPKTMTCKCGHTVNSNVYQLKKKALKMGTTIQELINNFVCQGCCQTKGMHKRGKK